MSETHEHEHEPISVKDDKIHLKYQSHTFSELFEFLAKLTSNLCKGAPGAPNQKEAFEKLQAIHHPDTEPSFFCIPTRRALKEHFILFDDLLFAGMIADLCPILIVEKDNHLMWGDATAMVYPIHDSCPYWMHAIKGTAVSENAQAILVFHMENFMGDWRAGRSDHKFYPLDVLLHEMAHAYLGIYLCRTGECGEKEGELLRTGDNGHGAYWVDVALLLEGALRRQLGLDLDTMTIDNFTRAVMFKRGWYNGNGGLLYERGWNDLNDLNEIPFDRIDGWGWDREKFMDEFHVQKCYFKTMRAEEEEKGLIRMPRWRRLKARLRWLLHSRIVLSLEPGPVRYAVPRKRRRLLW